MPRVGDKVTIPHAVSVLEVTHVSRDGDEVNLQRPGTNLEWFRVRTDTLTFVERKTPARTSNPFTNPEPCQRYLKIPRFHRLKIPQLRP